jgi:lysozyme family protein
MKKNYNICLDIILWNEGGYSDHPEDNGGATNYGISQQTLKRILGREVTKEEVKDLSMTMVEEIYEDYYWHPINGNNLPAGIDILVFDAGVNIGVRQATRILQRILPGVKVDGYIGPKTIDAVYEADAKELINEYSERRSKYYQSLSDYGTFGNGWENRNNRIRELSKGMVV